MFNFVRFSVFGFVCCFTVFHGPFAILFVLSHIVFHGLFAISVVFSDPIFHGIQMGCKSCTFLLTMNALKYGIKATSVMSHTKMTTITNNLTFAQKATLGNASQTVCQPINWPQILKQPDSFTPQTILQLSYSLLAVYHVRKERT